MKLFIDNGGLNGPQEYTKFVDAGEPLKISRRLNRPAELKATFVGECGTFEVPKSGARVWVERADRSRWFTGWIAKAPEQEFVGRGLRGSVVRYRVEAMTDEFLLDRGPVEKTLPAADSSVAGLVRRWTESAGEGTFDTSAVEECGNVAALTVGDAERWSEAVARAASVCRASYTCEDGAVSLKSIGAKTHVLDDADAKFIPEALKVEQARAVTGDWTVVGANGPGAYVKDYFFGDGRTLRFPMSQQPFLRPAETWVEEEYVDELSPMRWTRTGAATASGGKLVLSGAADLSAVEKLELGGCIALEHGAMTLSAASDGVIGGLYDDAMCVAGFQVNVAGSLQAVVNGAVCGSSMAIALGRRYEVTTRLYASEVFRLAQSYRWRGGEESDEERKADVRIVLEARDLEGASAIAPAIVLYDGLVEDAPSLATYSVARGTNLNGTIAYTRVRRLPTAEVRFTSASDGKTHTCIVGGLADGAECSITTEPALYFYSPYKPKSGDEVVVRYRASEQLSARVVDEDAGDTRAEIVQVVTPKARTSDDCRNAAAALVKECGEVGWRAEYATWTDLLPNGEIAPGDRVELQAGLRDVEFAGVVREVETEIVDGANDRARWTFVFADEAAEPIGMQLENSGGSLAAMPIKQGLDETPGVPVLANAEVTSIGADFVAVDAGLDVKDGLGIEVRREGDFGWGAGNDRNLIGRFSTRSFRLPRSTRAEDYYLRMYDGSALPRYSAVTALLHVDVRDDSI